MRRLDLPRFHFNIRHNGAIIANEEDDLPDLAAARALALDNLREMKRLPSIYGHPRRWRRNVFVITGEDGTVGAEVPYESVL